MLHALVHAADIQDRDGGVLVMATLFGLYPFLLKLYADGGYQGPAFRRAVKRVMAAVNVEIIKRSDQARGFVVLPRRWVVERTFAWLGRCRRLAKDWECLNRSGRAWTLLASIRLMLRRLGREIK
jgi:transposase